MRYHTRYTSSAWKLTRLSALLVPAALLSFTTCAIQLAAAPPLPLHITCVGDAPTSDSIEFRGVAAGPFDRRAWTRGSLHWLPDVRSPLLEPRPGAARNIYAPSIIARRGYWDIYYGAWDGVPTFNDRIYHTSTTDFLNFNERRTIIEHGEFHHVCNVSAVALGDHGTAMLCTGYPDLRDRNKPVFFSSTDGTLWNSHPPPLPASRSNIVSLSGYATYDDADINGMNVLFRDNSLYRMYFADFRNFGKVYRATSDNGTSYSLDGVALDKGAAPNDIKRFIDANGTATYLMGLHMNQARTWYATSSDGFHFNPMHEMFRPIGPADNYIVAIGFVTTGENELADQRLLGVLYGAGAVPSLDQNRIFARWLQKRVQVEHNGTASTPTHAYGPHRQLLKTTGSGVMECSVSLSGEDGITSLGSTRAVLRPGKSYQLTFSRE
ncbi:MAG: hypothetical protein ACR2IE_02800 [Candidatus Sumerlaeaceae bacterium]